MSIVIAKRSYQLNGREVNLHFQAPEQVSPKECACQVSLVGENGDIMFTRVVSGVDSVQALELAFRFARQKLEEFGDSLERLESRGESAIGIAKQIPTGFHPEFDKHLASLVDSTSDRYHAAICDFWERGIEPPHDLSYIKRKASFSK